MKIRTKFAFFYLFSTLTMAVFFTFALYEIGTGEVMHMADADMSKNIELVKDFIKSDNTAKISVSENSMMQKYWLRIIRQDKTVLFESNIAKILPLPDNKLIDGHTLTVYTDFVNFTGNKDVILRIKKSVDANGATIIMGYLLDDSMAYNYEKTVVVFLAILVLITIFVYFILTFVLRPLKDISEVLHGINEAKLNVRLKKYSNDEIGMLSSSLNALLEKLEKSFDSQKSFLSLMSHELKTPLSIIKTHIEQAIMDGSVPLELKSKFSKDLEQISRLDQFILRLLLLTRLEENSILLDIKLFNLSELVEEISDFIGDIAVSDDKELVLDIDDNIFVKTDKVLLHRAIINLCENAVKYSPVGKKVFVSLKKQNDFALLVIKDEAGGIKPDILQKAEDKLPFVAHGFVSGLGLRLAIMLLKASDIGYTFDIEEGVGTTIEIKLKHFV